MTGDFLVVSAPGLDARAIADRLRPFRGVLHDSTPVAGSAPSVVAVSAGGAAARGDARGGGVGVFVLARPSAGVPPPAAEECLDAFRETIRAGQQPRPDDLRGSFCFAAWGGEPLRLVVGADPFRTQSLYYAELRNGFACATDLRWLLATGLVVREVDLHAVYHYLNFGYVPTPFSIVKGARKVPPGCLVEATPTGPRITPYWSPTYPEDLGGSDEARASELRARIQDAVTRYQPHGDTAWGAFLSGGTDSSSVAGILARHASPEPVKTFSIGFEEPGYDELPYARIAARHFGLAAREHRVTAAEALEAIPRLVEAFDEPFGNASAMPTYACASLAAREGVGLLVAGDGGDEIFGGNERYRKDQILERYYRTPAPLRWPLESLLGLVGDVDWRPLNRVRNFVERGSVANPERFYTDDAFASECFDDLLAPDLRQQVARGESLELLRRSYAEAGASSELNRLLYIDLRRAITDCDLVKVFRASRLAGVAVTYPLLDPDLVAFTGRLPARDKVRGFEKRHLFKKAMAGILPSETIAKKKQGFGLPTAVWFRAQGGLRQMVHDVVFSDRARRRGYFNLPHVESLITRHEKGAWDHSNEIYLLLMLELWHLRDVDR